MFVMLLVLKSILKFYLKKVLLKLFEKIVWEYFILV